MTYNPNQPFESLLSRSAKKEDGNFSEKTKLRSFLLEESIIKNIKIIAANKGTNSSSIAREALSLYLKREMKNNEKNS